MLKRSNKQCKAEGCTRPVFSHLYCDYPSHQAMRTDSSYLRSQAKKQGKEKKRQSIKPLSSKRASEYAQYYKQREIFLAKPENRMCRRLPHLRATTVHHGMGKIGKLLLDERFWIPLSLEGHRWAEEHPLEAKELQLSFDRLS
jgi:hypothetical protein